MPDAEPPEQTRQPHLRRPRALRHISLNQMIPNMLTMLSLCGGLSAIRYAMMGRWEHCVFALLASAVLDTLDGRVARLLKGTSQFGAELDSLADLVAFGVAPALVLYLWSLNGAGPLGWVACLVFCCCAALRLARFNVAISSDDKPPFAGGFFSGVPTPAAAGLVLLPLILSLALLDNGMGTLQAHSYVIVPWTFLIGGLMISRMPTFSFKRLRIPQAYAGFLLLGIGLMAALLINAPWVTISGIALAYLASLPLALRSYRTQWRRWQASLPPPIV